MSSPPSPLPNKPISFPLLQPTATLLSPAHNAPKPNPPSTHPQLTTPPTDNPNGPFTFPNPQDFQCAICKVLVGRVITAAGSNTGDAGTVNGAINTVCGALRPGATACDVIIKPVQEQIVELVGQGKSAEEVCKTVGQCK